MSVISKNIHRITSLALLSLGLISGCGGGGGGGSGESPSSPAPAPAPVVLSPGKYYVMGGSINALVPPGTTIGAQNGIVALTVTGSSNTIYTEIGATISVPANATGLANNLVSTAPAPAGAISTKPPTLTSIAGATTNLHEPVDGTGTSAFFKFLRYLTFDANGNIIVSDQGALRKVTQAGVVTTLVPSSKPYDWDGIAIDNAGNIYGSGPSADTAAGTGVGFSASISIMDTTGNAKDFAKNWENSPHEPLTGRGGLVIDSNGNLFLADGPNNRIVKFNSAGTMSVFVGSGEKGASDGQGALATLNNPQNLAIDVNGNIFFNDSDNALIRKVTPGGAVTTVASAKAIGGAIFGTDNAIAVDSIGNIYFENGIAHIARVDIRGFVISYAFPILNGSGISSMAIDSKGNLFFATNGIGPQIWKASF